MARARNTSDRADVHTAEWIGRDSDPAPWGRARMQSTQPRDLGALILVIGLFLTLFVVSLLVGSPVR